MPSDETTDARAAGVMDVLSKAREEFRSALVATNEELQIAHEAQRCLSGSA